MNEAFAIYLSLAAILLLVFYKALGSARFHLPLSLALSLLWPITVTVLLITAARLGTPEGENEPNTASRTGGDL